LFGKIPKVLFLNIFSLGINLKTVFQFTQVSKHLIVMFGKRRPLKSCIQIIGRFIGKYIISDGPDLRQFKAMQTGSAPSISSQRRCIPICYWPAPTSLVSVKTSL